MSGPGARGRSKARTTSTRSRPCCQLRPKPKRNLGELAQGTLPCNPDTDGDGVNDGVEVKAYGTNPLVADTDGDGCGDGKEVASVNGDRVVNAADLAIVSGHIGSATSPVYLVQFDANKDGAITAGDLAIMAARFGPC